MSRKSGRIEAVLVKPGGSLSLSKETMDVTPIIEGEGRVGYSRDPGYPGVN